MRKDIEPKNIPNGERQREVVAGLVEHPGLDIISISTEQVRGSNQTFDRTQIKVAPKFREFTPGEVSRAAQHLLPHLAPLNRHRAANEGVVTTFDVLGEGETRQPVVTEVRVFPSIEAAQQNGR